MENKRQVSHAEKFWIIYSTLKEVECNSQIFKCGLRIVTSFQRVREGEKE